MEGEERNYTFFPIFLFGFKRGVAFALQCLCGLVVFTLVSLLLILSLRRVLLASKAVVWVPLSLTLCNVVHEREGG